MDEKKDAVSFFTDLISLVIYISKGFQADGTIKQSDFVRLTHVKTFPFTYTAQANTHLR